MVETFLIIICALVVAVGSLIVEVWAWNKRARKVETVWLQTPGRWRREQVQMGKAIYDLIPRSEHRRRARRDG